jgi:hypothetical protein
MDATWRKSSYSGGNGGNCIEVGGQAAAGRVLVRDTRDRQGPVLRFTPAAWKRFADQVRSGARQRLILPADTVKGATLVSRVSLRCVRSGAASGTS